MFIPSQEIVMVIILCMNPTNGIINVGVCPLNVYFPVTSFPLLPPLLGALLVSNQFVDRGLYISAPVTRTVTFDLIIEQLTSMLFLSFKSILLNVMYIVCRGLNKYLP